MDLREVVALAAALCALTLASRAGAWQEAHEMGDDVQVRVDPSGMASFEHVVRWHVVRGPLKSIDLVSVDPGAVLDPSVTITAEDGHALEGHLIRADEKSVRVIVDQPRSVMRGNFTFDVRWRLDLVASRALVRDGTVWRLALSSPLAVDGFDAARTVLSLPAAPEEPRPILADTGAVDESAVTTLRREADRDTLELVRPHVARGESASWTVRIDPRALREVADPRLRPAHADKVSEANRVPEATLAALLGALGLALGLLVRNKGNAFAGACEARKAKPRALLPLPLEARSALAGAAFGAGVGLQLLDALTGGGVLVAVATLAAALRSPRSALPARGPGRWLALRPEDAFRPSTRAGHWLDIDTTAGQVSGAIAVGLVLVLATVSRRWSSEGPWLVTLDAVVLVPLFLTGRASQLPPDGGRAPARWLERVFRRLRVLDALRVVPWARVIVDGSAVDELRLLVLPRLAMPGVIGIELGLAWSSTPVGWVGTPEVLVRVLDESAAASRLTQSSPSARAFPGRRSDERVLRLAPRRSSVAGTVALARALAGMLTDRRTEVPASPWPAPDRRVATNLAPA